MATFHINFDQTRKKGSIREGEGGGGGQSNRGFYGYQSIKSCQAPWWKGSC